MRKDPHQKDHSTRELMLKIKDNRKSFVFYNYANVINFGQFIKENIIKII